MIFSRKYLSWSTWHYINGGFGLALRANDSVFTLLRGGMNLARHTVVDKAIERAEAALV